MKKYIGSCADDSIGIGTMIVGDKYRTSNSDYAFEVHYVAGDVWIECYDVLEVDVSDESDIRIAV